MSEKKIKYIIFGFISFVVIFLIIYSVIGLLKLQNNNINNYESLQKKELSDKSNKVKDLKAEYDKKNQIIQTEIVKKENNIISKEDNIAKIINPLPPNIIVSDPYNDNLYIFDHIIDVGQDDIHIIKEVPDGQIYNSFDHNKIKIYVKNVNGKKEAYYIYESKIYIYLYDETGEYFTTEGKNKIDKENKAFFKEHHTIGVEDAKIPTISDNKNIKK